jgi:predicted PurR-regulated permease PerM
MAADPVDRGSALTDRERRWLDALLVLGTCAVALILLGLTANLVLFFGDVIIIFFIAWLLAFVLSPIAGFIVRLLPFLPRSIAVIFTYVLLIVAVLGIAVLAAQMLAESITAFIGNVPQIQASLPATLAPFNEWLSRFGLRVDLVDAIQGALKDLGANLQNLARPLSEVAIASLGAIGNLAIIVFLSIYIAVDSGRILAFVVRLVPPQYAEETRLLERSVSRSFGGFLRGQAIMGALYAVVAVITSLVFGLPYAPATAAITGVLQAIPFFGPFVSWAPPVAVALFTRPDVLIPVAVVMLINWFVIMNVVQPRLMAGSVGIHPVVVLGSIIVGGKVAGIPGAIFGIPVAAVLSSFFFYYLNRASADSRTVAQRAARRVAEREGRPVVAPSPPSLTEVHEQANGTAVYYRGPYAGGPHPAGSYPGGAYPAGGQPGQPLPGQPGPGGGAGGGAGASPMQQPTWPPGTPAGAPPGRPPEGYRP